MEKAEQSHTTKGSTTRGRILQAARKQLVEQGYEAFVMRELADSLGIKLGNLQYYFKTREALILCVIETEAARDAAMIQEHQQNSETACEAFRAIVRDLVARWRGHGGVLFSTLGTLSLHNKSYRQLYRSVYADFYDALEKPLREMNPRLSDEEVRLRVRLITALIDGSPMQTQVGSMQVYLDRLQAQVELIALA
jgi:AcrR family transcriptional regulator